MPGVKENESDEMKSAEAGASARQESLVDQYFGEYNRKASFLLCYSTF